MDVVFINREFENASVEDWDAMMSNFSAWELGVEGMDDDNEDIIKSRIAAVLAPITN